MNKMTPTVAAIGKMNFEGNIIPQSWYREIRTDAGKVDLAGCAILADIIYWYRPTEVRDEMTGRLIGYKRKFRGDRLQRSYEQQGDALGLTKDQARDALYRLADAGLIIISIVNGIYVGNGVICNGVVFLEPVPEAIDAITYRPIEEHVAGQEIYLPSPVENPTMPSEFSDTNTENFPKTISNTITSQSDVDDFDSIPSASGIAVPEPQSQSRMNAEEYKTRVRAAMASSGSGKKRAIADGKGGGDGDEIMVARILASVKDQTVLPSDLFRDKKNPTAIIYRRAAVGLLHEMKAMGKTLDDVKRVGDYFLNGGGERYRIPNVNYAPTTIASHFAERWRVEDRTPPTIPIEKLKVPDYPR